MNDSARPLLGVLGGMGPLATVDFLKKLIEEARAKRDADHVPVVVYSVPQIPDRPAAILSGGESPLPALLKGIQTLNAAGATCIAIPCNTAHYWYDECTRAAGVPILHIADAACEQFAARGLDVATVGLMGTDGTLAAGFYQQRLAARGLRIVVNAPAEQRELVLPAIAAVKGNDLSRGHALAVRACEKLHKSGAQAIILACTEIPPAIDHAPSGIAGLCVDATRALAHACVEWWHRTR